MVDSNNERRDRIGKPLGVHEINQSNDSERSSVSFRNTEIPVEGHQKTKIRIPYIGLDSLMEAHELAQKKSIEVLLVKPQESADDKVKTSSKTGSDIENDFSKTFSIKALQKKAKKDPGFLDVLNEIPVVFIRKQNRETEAQSNNWTPEDIPQKKYNFLDKFAEKIGLTAKIPKYEFHGDGISDSISQDETLEGNATKEKIQKLFKRSNASVDTNHSTPIKPQRTLKNVIEEWLKDTKDIDQSIDLRSKMVVPFENFLAEQGVVIENSRALNFDIINTFKQKPDHRTNTKVVLDDQLDKIEEIVKPLAKQIKRGFYRTFKKSKLERDVDHVIKRSNRENQAENELLLEKIDIGQEKKQSKNKAGKFEVNEAVNEAIELTGNINKSSQGSTIVSRREVLKENIHHFFKERPKAKEEDKIIRKGVKSAIKKKY